MIGEILPREVRFAERFDDFVNVRLFPEEEAVISRAVPKRRREFATVRHCARLALASLGHAALPLVPGEQGSPRWPHGITGSMTHCVGYRAAAVAHSGNIASIGIDAEPDCPLPEGVLGLVARPEEQRTVRQLVESEHWKHWDRLLFSAKESVYKTWFPLTKTWLGFEGASIDIDPGAGTFHACVLDAGIFSPLLREFHGHWLFGNGLIVTAITHPALS